MTQFDLMSVDLGLNRIHSLARFCANAVVDFWNSAKKENGLLNIILNLVEFRSTQKSNEK